MAKRKRFSYYTVIIDHESGKVLDLIDTRRKENVVEALKKYSNIALVTRDRSKTYCAAITQAFPEACQVPDRFHLTKDLTEAAIKELRLIMPSHILLINGSVFSADITSENEDFNKRVKLHNDILMMAGRGIDDAIIAEKLNITISLCKQYKEMKYIVPILPIRKSILDKYENRIIDLISKGYGYKKIYRILTEEEDYVSDIYVVRTYLRKLRKHGLSGYERLSREKVKRLFFGKKIEDRDAELLEKYLNSNHELSGLIELVKDFNDMLYRKREINVKEWIEKYSGKHYKSREMQTFIKGIEENPEEIANSANSQYSNGIAEGTINKIKMIKRMMYGRCNIKTLEAKIFLSQNRQC